MLEDGAYPKATPYFKGTVTGSFALMFAGDVILSEVLPQVSQLINDGTFKVI